MDAEGSRNFGADQLPELEERLKFWRRISYGGIVVLILVLGFGSIYLELNSGKLLNINIGKLEVAIITIVLVGVLMMPLLINPYYRYFMRYWIARGLSKDEAQQKWHELHPPGA